MPTRSSKDRDFVTLFVMENFNGGKDATNHSGNFYPTLS